MAVESLKSFYCEILYILPLQSSLVSAVFPSEIFFTAIFEDVEPHNMNDCISGFIVKQVWCLVLPGPAVWSDISFHYPA